jgi:hypothetical protein
MAKAAQAAGGADAKPEGKAVLFAHAIGEGEHRRKQRDEGLVVGVATRVGLGGEVLGDGDFCGKGGLLFGDVAGFDELAEVLFGRRREEALGDFDAGDLRDDAIGRDDLAALVAMDAVNPVADEGEREPEVSRRADQANTLAQVEIDDAGLEVGLVRAVDKVGAVGQAAAVGGAQFVLDAIDVGLDAGKREPGGAEEADHADAGHGDDDFDGADAVGHGAGDVGVADAEIAAEGEVAEGFGGAGGDAGEEGIFAVGGMVVE